MNAKIQFFDGFITESTSHILLKCKQWVRGEERMEIESKGRKRKEQLVFQQQAKF